MHGSYKTEAVVLRSLRLGEADRILHLYTPGRGRVGAVAKGVRRTRSRVGARLEPFSHVALVLHEGRGELHTISAVDTLATHHAVREQPERARIAGAAGEALLKMFAEGDPSPRVFAALCRLLDVLDAYAAAPGDIALDPLLLAFQLKLHGLAGFAPRLAACAACGTGDAPLVRFSAAAGGAVCGSCPGSIPLPPGSLEALAALLRSPLADLPGLSHQIAAIVSRCASDLNAEHGGFRLRSLALTAGG
jgi:DNA repair protein RecO (recombination protein O)